MKQNQYKTDVFLKMNEELYCIVLFDKGQYWSFYSQIWIAEVQVDERLCSTTFSFLRIKFFLYLFYLLFFEITLKVILILTVINYKIYEHFNFCSQKCTCNLNIYIIWVPKHVPDNNNPLTRKTIYENHDKQLIVLQQIYKHIRDSRIS